MDDPWIGRCRRRETFLDGWAIPRRLAVTWKSEAERMAPSETAHDVDGKTRVVMCDVQRVVMRNRRDTSEHILERTVPVPRRARNLYGRRNLRLAAVGLHRTNPVIRIR